MLARILRSLARPRARTEPAPSMAAAHALFDGGDYAGAVAAYRAALTAAPSPETWTNLGYSHAALGDPAAARDAFAGALAMHAAFAPALVGLGDLEARRGAHGQAVAHYRRAIAADPQLAIAHNNLGLSLTATGDLEEAWRENEWRWTLADTRPLYPRPRPGPLWDGSPLAGERLLVHWEQGFGDMIQHLRFLPQVAARVATYVFECPPPLERLVIQSAGAAHVVRAAAKAPAPPDADRYAALLSLPGLLGTTVATLPADPYLAADVRRAASLRAAWSLGTARLIGIVWRASAFEPSRNAPLALFTGLAAPGVRLVSLQKDVSPAEQAELAQLGIADAGSAFADFADTADAIAALDAVVTVDTSVAHLAGALGAPAVVLLNEPAAVRWMLDRTDTPWYPTLRLVRKAAAETWEACGARLAAAVAATNPPR